MLTRTEYELSNGLLVRRSVPVPAALTALMAQSRDANREERSATPGELGSNAAYASGAFAPKSEG